MQKWRFNENKSAPIRRRLLYLLLVVLIPVLLLQIGVYFDRFQNRRAEEAQANLEIARGVSNTFEIFVQDVLRHELAIGLAITGRKLPTRQEEMFQFLARNKDEYPGLHSIDFVSPEGKIVASTLSKATGMDLSDRPSFKEIRSGREWFVDDLIRSKTAGEAIFMISRGVRDRSGTLRGVVVATVRSEFLAQILSPDLPRKGTLMIVDRTGRLVCLLPIIERAWENRSLLDEYPSIRSALKGEEVTGVEKAGADKTSQLYAMVPIRSLGWVAGASIPEKEVLAPIAKGLLRDLGIFLIVAAGSLLVAFAVSRRISAPIEELRKSVSSMGAGTWGRKVDVRGPREIKDLAKTFNRMAEEIGEREARLGESERRYRTLFESMTEAFALAEIILDEDGKPCDYRLLEVNPAYERLTGISREAVLGKTARELFPDIGRERIERLGYVARTGHPTAFQECVQRLGKWFELYVFSPGRGKFGYLFLDITERKRADEALRRSELKYRIVAEHPYNCEFWLSPEGKFIYLSPSCKRITGYEAEEFMRDRGLSRSIIHPDDLAAFDRHRQEEEEGEEEVLGQEIQFRIVNADGTIRWIGHTCMRISDEEGRYLGIRGTNRDITIRKQAEDALRKSEEKYRDLVENLYDQVSELDINGHLLYLSPNFKQITGYDVEDYIGRDFLESVHPDDAPLLGMEIRKGFEQGYGHMVFRFRHKNGNWLWIESMGKTFQTSAGSLRGVVISRDITEHRNMEKELRRSHDELEMRVQERTAELETEIEQRKRTAEALRESEKELRYLSSQLLIAQEKERREVAGELHDNIWQILNTIRWEIEMIFFRHGKRGPSADPGRSQRIISDIRNAVERIRTMQGDLWPPLLDDIGIVATINWYCRDFEKNHPSIRIEKHIDLSEEDVPAPIRIVIYRVMKEALENVLRHSQASSTALSLRNTDHRIEFTLRDNGIGFDLERVFKRSMPWAGLGLMSMRERTEHTGGSFEIESGDGSGTTVRASWPVEA